MGIYLFKQKTLDALLTKTDYRDFGKEIFPASVRSHRVQTFLFDGYWEDIGTIRSFYDANLGLAAHNRPFDLASEQAPIYTRARFLAPSRLDGASVKNSLVADGCLIESGSVIENSVIGVRCRIGRNVTIRNSVLMGADFYCTPEDVAAAERMGELCVGIGDGSVIEGAIIDKDCRIGRDVRIVNERKLQTAPEKDSTVISDGIVVVEKEPCSRTAGACNLDFLPRALSYAARHYERQTRAQGAPVVHGVNIGKGSIDDLSSEHRRGVHRTAGPTVGTSMAFKRSISRPDSFAVR